MRKILIPTDFSKNALNASNFALKLYEDMDCTFYLLNAFQLYHFTTDSLIEPEPGEKEYEKAKKNSKSGLEKFEDQLRVFRNNSRHRFEIISIYNTVLDAVQEMVKEKETELIVMGTRGHNNPANVIYGSNAVNLMEKVSDSPVMVIPESIPLPDQPIKEIVFATNFKFHYKRQEFIPLLDVVNRYKAAIRILYIQENTDKKLSADQEANKEVVKDFLKDFECTFHTLTQIKVAAGIHSFIESRESDFLVLYNRKHNLFSSIFSKSLIKEIGYKPEVPVLVLKR